jgi:hypothetical protein
MPDAPSKDGMVLYRDKRVSVAERAQLRREHDAQHAPKPEEQPPEKPSGAT